MKADLGWVAYAKRHDLVSGAVLDAPQGNKFHAVRTIVDGYQFASRKEAQYYQVLKLREQAGEIAELVLQPSYELHVMQIWYSGGAIRVAKVGKFTADFEYLELSTGEIVTVDVKSPATAKGEAYRLRKKLVEAIHGLTITEV